MLMRNTIYWYINIERPVEYDYIAMETKTLYTLFKKHPFVYTDSRIDGKNGIFFALKGDNFDGNQFAAKALETASIAVVDDASVVRDKRYFLVEDALKTLQNLASYHRKQLHMPVIGITGTNGKTTTKELVSTVLAKKYNTYSTKGNFNNQIGVPISVLQINEQHEIAVIEMGASEIGDIEFLCKIAKPNYGIITNIARAHLESFGSFDNVVMAKSKLYRYLRENNRIAFIHHNDQLLEDIVPPQKTISYGTNSFTHIQGFLVDDKKLFVSYYWISGSDVEDNIDLEWIKKNRIVKTKIVGKQNFTNLLAATAVGKYFDVDDMLIKEAIENYVPENKRSQYQKTKNNEAIVDCYNANPTSMKSAITNFAELNIPNKTLILGDMLELGHDSTVEHELVISMVQKQTFNKIFLIGEIFFSLFEDNEKIKKFKTIEELIEFLKRYPLKECFILMKGSRGVKLENVLPYL